MCYQIVELYSKCRCLYYQHAVDRCASYGRPGHRIQKRTVLVNYACLDHSTNKPYGESHEAVGSLDSFANANTQSDAFSVLKSGSYSASDPDNNSGRQSPGSVRPVNIQSLLEPQDQLKDQFRDTPMKAAQPRPSDEFEYDLGFSGDECSDTSDSVDYPSDNEYRQTEETNPSQPVFDMVVSCLLDEPDLSLLWRSAMNNTKVTQDALVDHINEYFYSLVHFNKPLVNSLDMLNVMLRTPEIASRIIEACGARRMKSSGLREKHLDELQPTSHEHLDKIDDTLRAILLRGEAIESLKANLKLQITQRTPSSRRSLLEVSIETLYNATRYSPGRLVRFLTQMEQQTDSVQEKLEWTCPSCNRTVTDKYIENRPGGLIELKSLLKEYSGLRWKAGCSPSDEEDQRVGAGAQNRLGQLSGLFRHLAGKTDRRQLPEHREKQDCRSSNLDSCQVPTNSSSQTTKPNHRFMILCIPFMRWGNKAHQPDVCAVESDQDFFNLLRASYGTYRGQSRWSQLRRVQAISFIKFELFRNQLVNVCRSPFSPVGADYEYEEADTEPPIGANLMMHLFENPDHADIFPVLFRRIPRKMRERLQPCPRRGSSFGWGVQFVEALNSLYVFIFGCVGFIVCLAVSIAWTVAKDDIQGGFAIGGFMLAFILFCGGMLHSHVA